MLGDFDGAQFTHFGVTSSFFRRDGKFFVRTDGPDGELHDYEIAYVFGFDPLQQYLIEFPDGRLQALSVCWDSRPESEGGQRWFHLYWQMLFLLPAANYTRHAKLSIWTRPGGCIIC